MAQLNIQQAFGLALQHHQAGRLPEAAQLYQQILAEDPRHADALHYLGVIAQQAGQHDVALDLIRQAITLNPNDAAAFINLGNVLREKRRVDQAIAAYRQAIAIRPNYAEAHYNLGNALKEKGELDQAIAAYRQAIVLKPNMAGAHGNLGNALRDKGQLDEAIAAFRQAITLNPNLPGTFGNLGNALRDKGQLDEAVAAFRQAIALNPNLPGAHGNLGTVLKEKGQLDEAIAAYRQAIAVRPNHAEAHYDLALALKDKGQLDEAIAAYHQAVALSPNYAEAHYNLGNVLNEIGQFDQAIACYQSALAVKPDYPEAHFNLGNVWKEKGQLDQAVACFQRALALRPDWPEVHSNLGHALQNKGQQDQAIAAYRQAIRLNPDLAIAHSNLICTLHFHPDYDAEMIHAEHLRWQRQHAEPLKKFIRPHNNDRDPDRRLRVGYVSADFYRHVLAWAILPLLQQHDREKFEIFCYANVMHPDEITQRLSQSADQWRHIAQLADEPAAELIRQDRIDILVDLGLHTARNRLLLFAHKPAPVQVTYLGYCGATGLDTIDYRISDPFIDPPDTDLSVYTEQTIRLPDSYWCYHPRAECPDVSPPPAARLGFVTFGSMNKFGKVTQSCLDLWLRLLAMVPRSRMLIHANPSDRLDAIRQRFAQAGIEPDRLEFVGSQPLNDYLGTFARIDIALDPFPCGGGITTCDSLWMGVPVITLSGRTSVGRAGSSILNNVGLPQLVATTPEQYLQTASDLAADLNRLAETRLNLRPMMQRSPLLDGPRHTRNIEAAYRQMWRTYCQRSG